jgi:hypothetical protein
MANDASETTRDGCIRCSLLRVRLEATDERQRAYEVAISGAFRCTCQPANSRAPVVGFGLTIPGCDVPDWLPYLTAPELGLDRPKLTVDHRAGEIYVSWSAGA